MTKTRYMIRLVSALALVLGLASTGAMAQSAPIVRSAGSQTEVVFSEQISAEGISRLETARLVGAVEMVGSPSASDVALEQIIRVNTRRQAEARERALEYQATLARSGDIVVIESAASSWGNRMRGISITYRVTVPARIETDLQTAGGSIDLSGLAADAKARTSGGSIRTESHRGALDLQTSGGSISVKMVDGAVDVSTSGGSISLEDITGSVSGSTSGGSITVSSVEGEVAVQTSGGSVRADGVLGNFSGRTSGGSIQVREMGADVSVRTSGGRIRADRVGGQFEGRTSGGSISLDDMAGSVVAHTSGGSIEITNVQGSDVEAHTSGGDVSVDFTPQTVVARVDLDSSGGDIELALPAQTRGTFDVALYRRSRSSSDTITTAFDVPITYARDGQTVLMQGGDGPAQIRVRTRDGDIDIRKRG